MLFFLWLIFRALEGVAFNGWVISLMRVLALRVVVRRCRGKFVGEVMDLLLLE
jgi:hypothetical protein